MTRRAEETALPVNAQRVTSFRRWQLTTNNRQLIPLPAFIRVHPRHPWFMHDRDRFAKVSHGNFLRKILWINVLRDT
jgi:hypothetical protein